jgi:hyperosmotically inducible periplasmic protein
MIYRSVSVRLIMAGLICFSILTATPPVLAADPPATEKKGNGVDDGRIQSKLVTAYSLNEHLSPYDLDVKVDHGKVVLAGQVENGIERDLAEEIARGVDGVAGVDNQIRIEGEKAARTEPSPFYRSVQDATLTARVKSNLLWNQYTDGTDIDVDTDNGIVTLKGVVASEMEKKLAVQIAENTRGVRKVQEALRVDPETAGEKGLLEKTGDAVRGPIEKTGRVVSDSWITSKVKTVLMFNKKTEGADIDVDTDNGVVTLNGTVQSKTQEKDVVALAEDVVNVKSVVSRLRVR